MQFKSLQMKIAVWAGICLLFSMAGIVGYAAFEMKNQAENARKEAIRHAKEYAGSVAQHQATEIQVWLEVALDAARTLAQALSGARNWQAGQNLGRFEVNSMLKTILERNPDFVGVYTAWEPNAFDNKDRSYANYGDSGRFMPYWSRSTGGYIELRSIKHEKREGAENYYSCPQKTLIECAVEPFWSTLHGEKTLITSLSAPIMVKDQFYGVAGIDLRFEHLQAVADSVQLYNGSAVLSVFSHDGTVVATTGKPELAGESIQNFHADWREDLESIHAGELLIKEDEEHIAVFAPLSIGRTTIPWAVSILIPTQVITAEADAQMRQSLLGTAKMIGLGIMFTLLALGLLWRVARSIAIPIQQSARFAAQMAAGDLNAELQVQQNDELGTLADALRTMQKRLLEVLFETGALIQGLQQGQLEARGNAGEYSGSWRELVSGINNVVEAFQRPFQKTAEYLRQIAQGEMPDIIEKRYQGDFDDVRQNLNLCIETISGLTEETKTLTQAAIQGNLDARGYAQKFGGEYAHIVNSINDTIDTLVGHLDRIPVPVRIVDSNFRLLFINSAGAELLGGTKEQLQGKKCFTLFKSNHCRTPECICARAMHSLQREFGEAEIYPAGKHLSISQSSAPLISKDGKAIGALEILMDQTEIKQAMTAVQQQNWMRSGQAELNEVMRGEQDVTSLSQHIISQLVQYFQAGIGAIYLVDSGSGGGSLRLSGSYAYTRRTAGEETIALGQGFIGQAALERESIIYSDIPGDYLSIKNGDHYEPPQQILASPFFHEEQLKGVLAIGTSDAFRNAHIDFLKQTSESIAVAFHSAETRIEMKKLLEHSQQQAEELQAQTEELLNQTEELQALNVHQANE